MANIKVNQAQWSSLAADEQNAIVEVLRKAGSLKIGDRIIPDDNHPAFDDKNFMSLDFNPLKPICEAACDAVAATAAAACTANTSGVGLAVCLAAAEAARQECRNRC